MLLLVAPMRYSLHAKQRANSVPMCDCRRGDLQAWSLMASGATDLHIHHNRTDERSRRVCRAVQNEGTSLPQSKICVRLLEKFGIVSQNLVHASLIRRSSSGNFEVRSNKRLDIHGASACFPTAGTGEVNVTFAFCRSL
jgi:hypothetical protein